MREIRQIGSDPNGKISASAIQGIDDLDLNFSADLTADQEVALLTRAKEMREVILVEDSDQEDQKRFTPPSRRDPQLSPAVVPDLVQPPSSSSSSSVAVQDSTVDYIPQSPTAPKKKRRIRSIVEDSDEEDKASSIPEKQQQEQHSWKQKKRRPLWLSASKETVDSAIQFNRNFDQPLEELMDIIRIWIKMNDEQRLRAIDGLHRLLNPDEQKQANLILLPYASGFEKRKKKDREGLWKKVFYHQKNHPYSLDVFFVSFLCTLIPETLTVKWQFYKALNP